MYDLSTDLLSFYDKHVKLDSIAETSLKNKRDLNLDRISSGLAELGKPDYKAWRNQGGYAMKTVINDPAGESNHDIDVALIFEKADLPAGALAARQRVRDALCKKGTNFYIEPEARTNAVTVWYADGYHLDFAIYRRFTDDFGFTQYEHASTVWVDRDPSEVTLWFDDAIENNSPTTDIWGNKPAVRTKQLRRIVRLIKWFCRSRPSWSLPGGMITSALVVECYRSHRNRDDISLYNTLVAIKTRLQGSCVVYHPKGDGRELTGKTEYLNQVTRMKEKLEQNLPKLDVLFADDCTRERARSAWDWVFAHSFWADKEVIEEARAVKADMSVGAYTVTLGAELAKKESGRIAAPYRGQFVPKNMWLRFYIASTNVPPPYSVRFQATNRGDEASDARDLGWSHDATYQNPERWASTAYKGIHTMTCTIIKNGVPLASASMSVKIVGGLFRGRR